MISIRVAESDADLAAWIEIRRRVHPDEPAGRSSGSASSSRPSGSCSSRRSDGRPAAHGLADRSDTGQGFVAPRVLPEARRRGVGTALLERLLDHVRAHGFERARSARRRRRLVRVRGETRLPRGRPASRAGAGGRRRAASRSPSTGSRSRRSASARSCSSRRIRSPSTATPISPWRPGASRSRRTRGSATRRRSRRLDRRPRRGPHRRLRGPRGLGRRPDARRERPHRRRPRLARPRARDGHEAAASSRGPRVRGSARCVTWTQTGNEAMRSVNERLGYVTRTISRTVERPLEALSSAAGSVV